MSKSNKELVTELTIAYIQSWNAKTSTQALQIEHASDIFKTFKKLIESMDGNQEE